MGDLILASMLWSLSFSLIKTHLADLNPFLVALICLGLSLLVFIPFLRLKKPKDCLALMLLGSIQFGLMYGLYIASYKYLLAHQVALLTVSTPVLVVLMDSILERRWSRSYFWASILVVLGTGLLVFESGTWHEALKGAFLLTVANGCFAAGQLGYRKIKPKLNLSDSAAMSWMYLGAVLVPALFLLVSGNSNIAVPHETSQWLTLLYLGIIPSGIGFFLWNRGVTKINSGLVAIMNNLKIPLAALVSWIVFGETISWMRFLVCACLLFAAVIWVSKPTEKMATR